MIMIGLAEDDPCDRAKWRARVESISEIPAYTPLTGKNLDQHRDNNVIDKQCIIMR